MARTKNKGSQQALKPLVDFIDTLGLERVLDELGTKRVLDTMGAKRVFDEMGAKRLFDEMGADKFLSNLSPKQRRELKQRLEQP